jgi:hypothetical protein
MRLIFIIFLVIFFPFKAFAVRPFVTDDARIVSRGQFEIEAWPEINVVGSEQTYALQFMGGYSFTEWFELIAGTGAGYDREEKIGTFGNPLISPKFLFYPTQLDSLIPGIALNIGTTINWGRGSLYDESQSTFGFLISTWRFHDDWVNIHTNFGTRNSRINKKNYGRPYWGVGFDLGIIEKDYRIIFETYAGDPFEAIAPDIAFQWGVRWIKSDYVNLDLTFGTQKEAETFSKTTDRREYWAQVGIRLLFDTAYVKNPSYEGARGLFRR